MSRESSSHKMSDGWRHGATPSVFYFQIAPVTGLPAVRRIVWLSLRVFLLAGFVGRHNQQEFSDIRILGDVRPKICWNWRSKGLRVEYGGRDSPSVSRALDTSERGNAVNAVHPIKRAVVLSKLAHMRTSHETDIESDREAIRCASQSASERINGARVLKGKTGWRLERAISDVANICCG
jgi:hypothetical protein